MSRPQAPDVSIITATWRRPHLLALCLSQANRQKLNGLTVEHIVVSDGPDDQARIITEWFGAQFLYHEVNCGDWGASCHDTALKVANGRYCVFWNDDNEYHDTAIQKLMQATRDVDIGMCQCNHWHNKKRITIPNHWQGRFEYGDVDTMNCCVKTELARSVPWVEGEVTYGCDFRWFERLQERGATVRFVPELIGSHFCFDEVVPCSN